VEWVKFDPKRAITIDSRTASSQGQTKANQQFVPQKEEVKES
jgi:hypothetical protein